MHSDKTSNIQFSHLTNIFHHFIVALHHSEMMRIMKEYGSEVSNQTLATRKQDIKKASVVRQFRRWNPEFFRYFVRDANGQWQPRLGKEAELKRRAQKRLSIKTQNQQGKRESSSVASTSSF
jgi:hypothetical protein